MNIVLFLVSCCLLFGAATAQTWIAGIPVERTSGRGGRDLRTPPAVCTARFQSYCENDAKCDARSVIYCNGDKRGYVEPCDEGQYCVDTIIGGEAECKSTAPKDCADSSGFECTSEGLFPEPTDCNKFYQCFSGADGSLSSKDFKCPKPYVFDPSGPSGKFCRLTNGNSAYCSKVDCSSYKSVKHLLMRFTWFPASSGQYVVTCFGGRPLLVTKCPAGLTANLAGREVTCDLVCTRAAVAAHPTDITKYYECLYNADTRRWENSEQDCFMNTMFDVKVKACVDAPKCTNGANNPPKCNECSGNRAFVDGSCIDCGTRILNADKSACEKCPGDSEYDTKFKGCACEGNMELVIDICTDCETKVLDPTTKKCVNCPLDSAYDDAFKGCKCNGNAALINGVCTDCEKQILDTVTKACVNCPERAAIDTNASPKACKLCIEPAIFDNSAKTCTCSNNGNPFEETACSKCIDGTDPAGTPPVCS